jgi:hypothetical protein
MKEEIIMGELDVLDVYRKIKEIKDARRGDHKQSISIDEIVQELDGSKEIINEYITALTILEFVAPADKGHIVLIK